MDAFARRGIAELFSRHWRGDFTVEAFGKLRTCMAVLIGEVVEALPDLVFDHDDTRFPLTVAVAGTQTSSHPGGRNERAGT